GRGLRLALGGLQLVHHDEGTVVELRHQRRFQRAALDLLRQGIVVAARVLPERVATVPPQRCARRPDLRTAGALLLVGLLAAAADEGAVLGLVGATAFRRVLPHDRFPHEVGLDRAREHGVAQVDRPDLLVLAIHYIECHGYFLPFFGFSACGFGSGFRATARRITTTPSGAPGTAPRNTSRWFSMSTLTTRRFRVVMREPPIRPAARMPLTTRDGNEDAPIDPGARWNIEPCVAAPPPKWCRFTTPWNPLPRPVPTTSTRSPSAKIEAST